MKTRHRVKTPLVASRAPSRRHRGFTIVELIIFIVVVGAALTGVMSVLNMTVLKSADPMIRKNMLSIAEALLEEVELMPFTYCDPSITADPNQTWTTATSVAACNTQQGMGPANGEVRVSVANPYNNVGDYSGGAPNQSITLASPITDITGNNSAPAGYNATIALTAEPLGPSSQQIASSSSSAANMNVFRITVTVTYGSNSVVLEGYRARYWPNNLPW